MPQVFDLLLRHPGHGPEIRDAGVVMRQHRTRERLDLRKGRSFPTQRNPRLTRGFDAAEKRHVPHFPPPLFRHPNGLPRFFPGAQGLRPFSLAAAVFASLFFEPPMLPKIFAAACSFVITLLTSSS